MIHTKLVSKNIWQGKLFDVVMDNFKGNPNFYRVYIRTHFEAVVVLPLSDNGNFTLVKQFRPPANSILIEAVAGKIYPGETPEKAAQRELIEETGLFAKKLVKLGEGYSSPGLSTEKYHFFFATNLENKTQNLDENENIETISLSAQELENTIASGKIIDAKTIAIFGLWRMI